MNIERVPISKVVPWDKNPRGIKTKDFDRLKKQITKLGVYKPLVCYRENGHYVVLGGNMRIRALKDLGIEEVEVSIITPKSEAQKIEYALSDNDRVGYYEEEALAELVYPHIKDIDLGEFKVDLGEPIDLKQVVERYGPDIDDGADDVPEVDDTPALTKPGDLFTLGRHRVMCGDSTKAEDVARLMRGEKAGMMVTDPPYGVEYDPTWRDHIDGRAPTKMNGLVANDDTPSWAEAFRLFSGDVIYTYHAGSHAHVVAKDLIDCGFDIRAQLVWRKHHFALSRGAYHCQHEPIWYAVRMGRTAHWCGDRTQSTVWDIQAFVAGGNGGATDEVKTGHGTQKPIECMARPIRNHDIREVYDPFLGSGTTLIAAEKLNRTCFGMEIDCRYVDVIVTRYCQFVGTDKVIRNDEEITWPLK
jgi:DNA modification methylase